MKTASKAIFAIAVLATVALAADKPNFSGEWVMDASKCEFGPIPPPDSMTRKVDHADPAMTVTQTQTGGPQGDQTSTAKYTTDGKENVNQMMGNDVKSKATWEGNSLVIASKLDMQGNEIALTSKWTLSADGKVLTDLWHIATPQGEFDVTYVLNKK
jgi:hypothetical protein